MKQGMTRKLKPKPKQDTKSWQRRNEARKEKQEAYAATAETLVDHTGEADCCQECEDRQ